MTWSNARQKRHNLSLQQFRKPSTFSALICYFDSFFSLIDWTVHPAEKSNTPCSDSGHSSPDTAEDLRLTNNPTSSIHSRRHNAPPMITLTPTSRTSPQRMFDKQTMRVLGGKNHLHDLHGDSMMSDSVPASPTKRFRPDFSFSQQHTSNVFPHMSVGHIELRHGAAERLAHDPPQSPSGLHPITAARLLGRRRLSSDESMMGRSSSSYPLDRSASATGLPGIAAAYHHGGAPTIPVPCTVPSLAAGSAILSRLQHRRNSTGGSEGTLQL